MSVIKKSFQPRIIWGLAPGLVAFILITSGRIINPLNLNWLGLGANSDPIQAYLGWSFYRRAAWSLPIGSNPDFGMLRNNSIVYSDSIPILAIPLKFTLSPLTLELQYFGVWLLLCFLMQSLFTFMIVNLFTRSYLYCASSSIFLLFLPFFLNRINLHLALSGHFLILCAIYLYLGSIRRGSNYLLAWSSLIVASTLVHAYLLIMVCALFTAHIFRILSTNIREKFRLILMVGALMIFIFFVAKFVAGYSVVQPDHNNIGIWGFWAWNSVSLLYPNGWSSLFQALPSGKGNVETATYLGIGVLITIAISILVSRRTNYFEILNRRDLFPLLFASVSLALFAITNQISMGSWKIELPFPADLVKSFTALRASGRMIWPLLYLLVLFALVLIARNIKTRIAIPLIMILALVQVIDTRPGWSSLFRDANAGKIGMSSQRFSPEWKLLRRHYEEIVVIRNSDYEVPGWSVVAEIANLNQWSTNCARLSRADLREIGFLRKKIENELRTSNLKRGRIYVLLSEQEYAWALDAVAKNSQYQLRTIDGLKVLLPN